MVTGDGVTEVGFNKFVEFTSLQAELPMRGDGDFGLFGEFAFTNGRLPS